MIDWQKKVIAPLVRKFGQMTEYTQNGINYPLNGVFDEAYTSVDVSQGMPITTVSPCLGFNLADLPITPKQGDVIFVFAALGAPLLDTRYIIKNVQIDGHGWCRLMLNIWLLERGNRSEKWDSENE